MSMKFDYEYSDEDRRWMAVALREAGAAMAAGEVPIGCVLVGGGKEVARGQTQTSRRGSMAAHGELCTLLDVGAAIYKAAAPLHLYTTLEPCLMCIGACVNCGVDRVTYAMRASVDGGVEAYARIQASGLGAEIRIQGELMCEETVALMGEFVRSHPKHFGHAYASAIYEAARGDLESRKARERRGPE